MGTYSVKEMVKRYEDFIAAECSKTWVSKPFKMQDFHPEIIGSIPDVSVTYPVVVEPAPGEPCRGVLKVIDAVKLYSVVRHDDVGRFPGNESFKLEYLPVSQSIGKHQWIHKSHPGCFNLVARRLSHIFSPRRSSNRIMQLDQQ